jgi:phospholipid/cholesterol/gamma-HCH transport system substrate-binding protein
MEDKVKYSVVGAFVLLLGTVLVGATLWLSSGQPYGGVYDIYRVYTSESVSGLNVNAPVRYRGVEVGRVRKIALAPGNVEQVQLTLAIDSGTPVKEDTVAVLQTQGLTGIAFVDLTGGTSSSPRLRSKDDDDVPVIHAGPSLMVRLDASLTDAAHVLKNLARLSDDLPPLGQRLIQSAETFDRMSNDLARAGDRASDKFTQQTLPQAQRLMTELHDLTASLRRVSDQLERNPSMLLYGKPATKRGPGE